MSVTDQLPTSVKLKLFADISPDGTSEANVPIRWCVTPALMDLVKQNQIADPYLLIVVRPYTVKPLDGGEEARVYSRETSRHIVPLLREMQYVSFSRPGNNSVFATIVWNEKGHGAWYMERALSGVDYDSRVFDYDGEIIEERSRGRYVRKRYYSANVLYEVTDEITVSVPKEMFAKEPPQWKKELVGKFFDSGEFDECHLRKRWWFFTSWFSVLFYFPFAYLARTLQLAFGLLLGLRDVSVKGFRHPIKYGFTDVLRNAENPIWWVDKNGEERNPLQWLFNPVTPLVLSLAIFGIGSYHDKHGDPIWGHGWWTSVKIALLVHVAIFALVLVIGLLAAVVGAIFGSGPMDWLKKRVDDWFEIHDANKRLKREREKQEMLAALEAMACSQTSTKVSVDALPKEKQTFRLRFQATKHKVCKPFAH